MRTKTTRTTPSLAIFFACLALTGVVQAQKKQEPYALVRGSVFHESGRAQPGAKVVLSAASQSPNTKPGKKLQEQISSPQGEFAFRVPPGPGFYVLTATLKGFEPATKEVEIVAQEQINKTLLLVPVSKK
jgi:hypothetical protein